MIIQIYEEPHSTDRGNKMKKRNIIIIICLIVLFILFLVWAAQYSDSLKSGPC